MNRLEAKLQKIGSDPKITAKAVGLRYSSPTHKGYYREKDKNSAFIYKDENNKTVKDKLTIERIKKLVIPPAWEEV